MSASLLLAVEKAAVAGLNWAMGRARTGRSRATWTEVKLARATRARTADDIGVRSGDGGCVVECFELVAGKSFPMPTGEVGAARNVVMLGGSARPLPPYFPEASLRHHIFTKYHITTINHFTSHIQSTSSTTEAMGVPKKKKSITVMTSELFKAGNSLHPISIRFEELYLMLHDMSCAFDVLLMNLIHEAV